MSETNQNDSFQVAADALTSNAAQQEQNNFLLNDKKNVLKNQKPIKMKSGNETTEKSNDIASAAEKSPLYDSNNNAIINNSNGNNPSMNANGLNVNNAPVTTTPVNSTTYFANRSNTNINNAKKTFEKRYNSISFSPNVNLHSSILNSSPILKPKKTLHVTNFTMNKCALRNLLLSFPGFKTVAFYQDYCFVVFADIESATAAAEQLLAKTKLKVNFSKADYIPNVVSPSSIGNPNSILHVTNYPTSTTETEMIEMYSSYPGYLHIHFSKNFSLVYYQDIASAKNVLQHMNQTTNFTTIYSIKNANNSPINMNNNYHNNVPNGPPPPFNPLMNNGFRNMGVNGGLVMTNGYPQPPVSVTAPTTTNFNANGVINHPHTAPNTPHNNSFIKFNNSNTNLAGLNGNMNPKNMNGFGMPPNGANNSSGNLYGLNGNGPMKMNGNMPNGFYGGMAKPLPLSPNVENNANKNFNNPYKNQNTASLRKQSDGANLSSQLLNMNINRGEDTMMKSSLIQSKSDSNINGLLNRKNPIPLMTPLDSGKNNSSNNANTISGNNDTMNTTDNSPFYKKNSIYDEMKLLSAGNYGMDRNEFMGSRKLSNSSAMMEGNPNNNFSGNYPNNNNTNNNTNNSNVNVNNGNNKKFMLPPDVTITPDYANLMKGNGYNSMLPIQNYGNFTNPSQNDGSNKVNITDPMPKDLYNQMNYSDMNDPNSIFNNLNRTFSDPNLSQNKIFEGENDMGNTTMNDKIHPSLHLNSSPNEINNGPANPSNFNSNEKLSFMPLGMGGPGSVLNGNAAANSTTNTPNNNNNNENLRPSLKQHSLSSLDLFGMKNLYNNGPLNSTNFSNPLMKNAKNDIPFVPASHRTNSSSPYVDFNGNNNILSSNLTNTSFTNLNGFPSSILNKSKSFCAINSLNNEGNKNPNDLSFTSLYSNDKKDSNSSMDGNLLMKNTYGVESPKSMYEPGLKNLRVNDLEFEPTAGEKQKSVGVIGESAKNNEKANGNEDNDYIKVNSAFSSKDIISSSYSDSSVNENDFIEFIATKRPEAKSKENDASAQNNSSSSSGNNELEVKESGFNTNGHKSSISSANSPTFINSPTYNEKNDSSSDEALYNNNGKVSTSSSSTQVNSKMNNMSNSTLDSFEDTLSSKIKTEEIKGSNDDLIKQLYAKIEQLTKENNELSQTRDYHLFYISKLENQLEMIRTENNNLKEQLNRL